jgi:membrane associated rhomboid family serine protease
MMDTAIYALKTFIYVLLGTGGAESVALWSAIIVFVVGAVLAYREHRAERQDR